MPEVWLLGSGTTSAEPAARQGRPFVFARHFAGHGTERALAAYRSRFRPSRQLARPKAFVVVNAVVADTARPSSLAMPPPRSSRSRPWPIASTSTSMSTKSRSTRCRPPAVEAPRGKTAIDAFDAALETVAPRRFDTRLGRVTTGPLIDMALKRDRDSGHLDDFDQQVQEVLAFRHHDFPADHPFRHVDLMPTVTARPDPWLLGSSGSSAGLAAAFGIGYSFAGFINPGGAVPALRAHRKAFNPTPYGAGTPQVMLGVAVFAAESDEEAHRMTWPTRAIFDSLGRTGRVPVVPSIDEASRTLTTAQKDEPSRIVNGRWPRQVAGRPETVRDQLLQMIEQTGATEVMLQSISPDQEARRYSHALIADALGVRPEVGPTAFEAA